MVCSAVNKEPNGSMEFPYLPYNPQFILHIHLAAMLGHAGFQGQGLILSWPWKMCEALRSSIAKQRSRDSPQESPWIDACHAGHVDLKKKHKCSSIQIFSHLFSFLYPCILDEWLERKCHPYPFWHWSHPNPYLKHFQMAKVEHSRLY